jgi:hypothetical protein
MPKERQAEEAKKNGRGAKLAGSSVRHRKRIAALVEELRVRDVTVSTVTRSQVLADEVVWRSKLIEQISSMRRIAVEYLSSSVLAPSSPAALLNAWQKLLEFEYRLVKDAKVDPEDESHQVGQLVQRASILAAELERMGMGKLVRRFSLPDHVEIIPSLSPKALEPTEPIDPSDTGPQAAD